MGFPPERKLTRAGLPASKYRGVSWSKERFRWQASISKTIDGVRRQRWLGCHDSEEAAARAYNAAVPEFFSGEEAARQLIIIEEDD
jgi:hypothetical protein